MSKVDVVWGVCTEDNLKGTTRAKGGAGKPRRVTAGSDIPGNWRNFLRNDNNKTELFTFLAFKLEQANIPQGKQLFLTCREKVLINPGKDVPSLSPCGHEEADTRDDMSGMLSRQVTKRSQSEPMTHIMLWC